MKSTKHIIKVAMAWTSIVYAVCFAGVAMFGGIRPGFMMYAFHMRTNFEYNNIMTFGTFFSGLVIWNLVVLLLIVLYRWLDNAIKD